MSGVVFMKKTEKKSKKVVSKKKPKKVSIKWVKSPKYGGLSQSFSTGLEFCLVSDKNHQCSPFMFCKDYIQDAMHGVVNSMDRSIYGFSYKTTQKHHPSIQKAKFVVANSSDSSMRDKVPCCLDFIHQIEEVLGIDEKTEILEALEVTDKTPAWLKKYFKCSIWSVEGSARWLISPVMISLYTLLIRVGFAHEIGKTFKETINDIMSGETKPYTNCDTTRLKGAIKGINIILKRGDKKVFFKTMKANYPRGLSMNDIHNTGGIVSFANERKGSESHKKLMERWHKRADKKKLAAF